MELKNALAICLIAFVSATAALLIARALDLQTAAQLEPQLTRIADELEALRRQGGIAPGGSVGSSPLDDGLIVYFFHNNTRCPGCLAVEKQSHELLESDFADELASGQIAWKVVNFDEPAGARFKEKFGLHVAVVVLAKMKGGEIEDWKSLDEVLALVGDKPAFADFLRGEIRRMLEPDQAGETAEAGGDRPPTPAPAPEVKDGGSPADVPTPDIPIPQ